MKNAQGDVIGIVNDLGDIECEYQYDPWGNCTKIYSNWSYENYFTDLNPIRYKGYIQDDETGYYYLQSRYYNPEWCRFLNADEPSILSLTQGELLVANLFAYCMNNPVMNTDPTGEIVITITTCIIIGAIVGLVAGASYGAISGYIDGKRGWSLLGRAAFYGAIGGVIGGLVGWGAGAILTKFGVIGVASSITGGGGASFTSFDRLKTFLGKAGSGRVWHHIVEQCQALPSRAKFAVSWIQNTNNVINIDSKTHDKISAFYRSKHATSFVNTGGMIFRDWLNKQSFQKQYEWGIKVLRYFGVKV